MPNGSEMKKCWRTSWVGRTEKCKKINRFFSNNNTKMNMNRVSKVKYDYINDEKVGIFMR